MTDREMIAVFHYDDGGSNRLGAEPYRYAEEIVRCKECKHRYVEEQSWGEYNEFCDFWCDGNGYWASVNADDFCSYAERRSDDSKTDNYPNL